RGRPRFAVERDIARRILRSNQESHITGSRLNADHSGGKRPCVKRAGRRSAGSEHVRTGGCTTGLPRACETQLLLGRAAMQTTKPLRFIPNRVSLCPEATERGYQLYDEKADHGWRPPLASRRSIARSASSFNVKPRVARYCSTARSARRCRAARWTRSNRVKNEGLLVGAENQAPVVS